MSKAFMKQSKGKSKFSILLYTGGFPLSLPASVTYYLFKDVLSLNRKFKHFHGKATGLFFNVIARCINLIILLSVNIDVKRQFVTYQDCNVK